MVNWQLNNLVKNRQMRNLFLLGSGVVLVIGIFIMLLTDSPAKPPHSKQKSIDLTGIVDESFMETVGDNASTIQQTEMESLKKQIKELALNLKTMSDAHQKDLQAQKEAFSTQVQELALANREKHTNTETNDSTPQELRGAQNAGLWHNAHNLAMNNSVNGAPILSDASPYIHTVSFRSKPRVSKARSSSYLNSAHYVPSNTSVRAVILGGADADASVNGQSKNNGVMLFKFLEDGTLPNGQRSHLRGCRVSANSYGDISSERAFATLYKLSCAHPGQPIIDKEVTGWVFYNGKVGIKGKPLMRDNKVMTWAGVSGALSGIASAAQYAQSIQAISPYGATSVVPGSQIGPYAAYGGAAKAADTLSQYYVKRAEQYHPVIQVGSANQVTIVFKDGFYLEPEQAHSQHSQSRNETSELIANQTANSDMTFTVPPEVLGKIDKANSLSSTDYGAWQ